MRGTKFTATDILQHANSLDIDDLFIEKGDVQNVIKTLLNKNLIAIIEKGVKGKSVNVYANVHWDK